MPGQALFVMAKSPKAGQVKTRLCPPLTPIVAARLYQCFLSDVLELVAGLPGVDPVVAYSPADAGPEFARLTSGRFLLVPQEGQDLGGRLENTFRVLFRRGYDRVAAVSTDSPDLPRGYLEEAFVCLADTPVVLGPCPDGGYYLIGLSRMIPEVFRDMPWSTDRVVALTAARVKGLGMDLSYLPEWHDVDTGPDLERLVRELVADGRHAPRAPRTAAFCRQVFRSEGIATDASQERDEPALS